MKRAIYVGMHRIEADIFRIKPRIAEIEIAEDAGIDPDYVFVDIPQLKEAREIKAMVNIDGEIMKLEDASPLVKTLEKSQKEVWKMKETSYIKN